MTLLQHCHRISRQHAAASYASAASSGQNSLRMIIVHPRFVWSSYTTGRPKTKRWVSTKSTMKTDNKEIDTPILIVGGGPTGLLMANLLNHYKVEYQLLEQQTPSERFRHPQAHFLNSRTMEVLKHALPETNIYSRILRAMPPVDEWKRFHFGTSLTSSSMIATVEHPVDRPLLANQDVNGRLLPRDDDDDDVEDETNNNDNNNVFPLSDCTVGHLAQHKFCKILYEAAMGNNDDDESNNDTGFDAIHYGTRVLDRHYDESNGQWKVTTTSTTATTTNDEATTTTFNAKTIIAADGAKSEWRDHLQIPMRGQAEIQHLINVYFTIPSEDQQQPSIPPAMLYTIFSSSVLGMVVRHGPKDYVMQIPYFPPYQSPTEDFSEPQVRDMIRTALGSDDIEFEIQSIAPWTMGSLVAERYYQDNVYLVGDAAHVFPPAGGLGMNTGLQDVYSLAWRLCLEKANQKEDTESHFSASPLEYAEERPLIARQNAALSVRNYHRVLGVMEACYLHHQHPKALIAGLEATSGVLPLKVRRQTFQTLLKTALWPLEQLKATDTLYSRHVTKNLRTLLRSGQGLPLLFPQQEVGFRLTSNNTNGNSDRETNNDWTKDTWANAPALEPGTLFPHMLVQISLGDTSLSLSSAFPYLCFMGDSQQGTITTRDLPAQFATPCQPIMYCVLCIHPRGSQDSKEFLKVQSRLEEIAVSIESEMERAKFPCTTAHLLVTETGSPEEIEIGDASALLFIDKNQWQTMNLLEENEGAVVVIRPDGHVLSISRYNT